MNLHDQNGHHDQVNDFIHAYRYSVVRAYSTFFVRQSAAANVRFIYNYWIYSVY